MIKLIATDIDGTLVNDEKELPPDFMEVISMLEKKDIHFAIASGRSYTALENQFGDIADRISFICDNGAYIVENGKLTSSSVIPKNTVDGVVRVCEKCGLIPLLCGQHGTYYSSESVEYTKEVARYYTNTP